MKLYYTPGACSMAVHIALHEANAQFKAEKVDLKSKKTESGKDFGAINEKSSVPYLELDNNEGISEVAVILQYIADQHPSTNLAPKYGSMERIHLNEWLNFIASELHKSFFPFFKDIGEQAKEAFTQKLKDKFAFIDKKLQGKDYVTGSQFTIADAYLFVMLSWAEKMQVDTSALNNLASYKKRLHARPAIQKTLAEEGLEKKQAA